MVDGYSSATWWAVAILVLAAGIALTMIRAGHQGGPAAASRTTSESQDEVKVPVVAH